MSGKRRALEQLTDSSALREDRGHSDDEEEEIQPSKQASADVLSRRKILKPRGFKPSPQASTAAFTPKKPSPLVSNSPINSNNGHQSIETNSKVKALNINFIDAITKLQKTNAVADLRPILNKYINFYEDILSKKVSNEPPLMNKPIDGTAKTTNAFGFLPKPQQDEPKTNNSFSFLAKSQDEPTTNNAFSFLNKPQEESSKYTEKPIEVEDVSSSSDSDDDIKVEGPKFTLAAPPTTKNSVFTFGAKPKPEIEFSDSDSEDDVKVEGPKFTLSNNPTENKSFFGGFKLNNTDNGFKFSLPSLEDKKIEEDKKEEAKEPSKPAFNFLLPPSADSKPFSFTNKTETTAPAFSFSKPESKEQENKPAFSFGASDKPASPFNAPQTSTDKEETKTDKPAFSFSAPATDKEETKTDKPAFSFGATRTEPAKPAFSFGATTETKTDKPAFSFGATTQTKTDKPAFSFGESKPAFSFGSTTDGEKKEGEPKKFNFASSFNFGGATTTPLFSFTPSNNTSKQEEEKVEEHEPTTDFKPVVTLEKEAETKTGEEDEVVKYTKRSKLSLLANNEYQSKGLGELKVLFNSTTSKTRVLIRSDGSLRVLLNSSVHKDFTYEKVGQKGNMLKFPSVNGEGALETYVIQVKTAADADDLLKAIEEGKN